MEDKVPTMTLGQLQAIVTELAQQPQITSETPILLDTGWESLQEIDPQALSVAKIVRYEVEDLLTKEVFGGYQLAERASEKKEAAEEQLAIVLENHY